MHEQLVGWQGLRIYWQSLKISSSRLISLNENDSFDDSMEIKI